MLAEVFAVAAETERPQRTAGRSCLAGPRTVVRAAGAPIG